MSITRNICTLIPAESQTVERRWINIEVNFSNQLITISRPKEVPLTIHWHIIITFQKHDFLLKKSFSGQISTGN